MTTSNLEHDFEILILKCLCSNELLSDEQAIQVTKMLEGVCTPSNT